MNRKLYLRRGQRVFGPFPLTALQTMSLRPGDMVSADMRNWVPLESVLQQGEGAVGSALLNGVSSRPAADSTMPISTSKGPPPFPSPQGGSQPTWMWIGIGSALGGCLLGVVLLAMLFLGLQARSREMASDDTRHPSTQVQNGNANAGSRPVGPPNSHPLPPAASAPVTRRELEARARQAAVRRVYNEVKAIAARFEADGQRALEEKAWQEFAFVCRNFGHRLATIDMSNVPDNIKVAIKNTSDSALQVADAVESIAEFNEQAPLAVLLAIGLGSAEGLGQVVVEGDKRQGRFRRLGNRFAVHYKVMFEVLEQHIRETP